MPQWQIWIAARREAIQSIRRILKTNSVFDESKRIVKLSDRAKEEFVYLDVSADETDHFQTALPTIFHHDTEVAPRFQDTLEAIKSSQLHEVLGNGTATLLARIIASATALEIVRSRPSTRGDTNPVRAAVYDFLSSLQASCVSILTFPDPITTLTSASSWSYQIYPPLLLLSVSTFSSSQWQLFLSIPSLADWMTDLYIMLCQRLRTTHIAINAPIPQTTSRASLPAAPSLVSTGATLPDHIKPPVKDNDLNPSLNLLRAPTSLIPLHGSFGSPTALASPSSFTSTLWATALQNGIYQVFAPLHTMFSRGNIKEKARVLNFPGLEEQTGGEGVTAVDLYAGIGYFAFSYRKAGARTLLGWEINPWSVEGFRRGAERNRWGCRVVGKGEEVEMEPKMEEGRQEPEGEDDEEERQRRRVDGLVIFGESNEFASERVKKLRGERRIPPVRHVNCGYLPSSRPSWRTAVECLDPVKGGWVHAHENVGAGDIGGRRAGVEERFRELVAESKRFGRIKFEVEVRCEHVEKVKTYAPGVVHCVFDIYIQPNLCC